ncbi:hypothetical protein V8E51_019318 [Hyaloscypha variabilis]
MLGQGIKGWHIEVYKTDHRVNWSGWAFWRGAESPPRYAGQVEHMSSPEVFVDLSTLAFFSFGAFLTLLAYGSPLRGFAADGKLLSFLALSTTRQLDFPLLVHAKVIDEHILSLLILATSR